MDKGKGSNMKEHCSMMELSPTMHASWRNPCALGYPFILSRACWAPLPIFNLPDVSLLHFFLKISPTLTLIYCPLLILRGINFINFKIIIKKSLISIYYHIKKIIKIHTFALYQNEYYMDRPRLLKNYLIKIGVF